MQCDDDGERRSACYASDIDHAEILLWSRGGSAVRFNCRFRRPGGVAPPTCHYLNSGKKFDVNLDFWRGGSGVRFNYRFRRSSEGVRVSLPDWWFDDI